MKQTATKTARNTQAGVTILEFIAFIGLAAVVIAGALGLYKTANTGSNATAVASTANALVAAARSAGVGGDYSWTQLCMDTACAGTYTQIPAIAGWAGSGGVFTKGLVKITMTGAKDTAKGVSIYMPDVESAVAVSKISVGSAVGSVGSAGTSTTVTYGNIGG